LSSWEEVENIFTAVSAEILFSGEASHPQNGIAEVIITDVPIEYLGGHPYLVINIPFRDGKVVALNAAGLPNQYYSLRTVLKTFGEPSEIYVSTFNNVIAGRFLNVFLVYGDKKLMMLYSDFGEREGNTIRGCFEQSGSLYIWDGETQFPDLLPIYFGVVIEELPMKALIDAAGIEVSDFVDKSLNGDMVCISTEASLWPDQ
jgi:hypothetical protein